MATLDGNRIVISSTDFERIESLIAAQGKRRDRPTLVALTEELERAEVREAGTVPADVVTMGSRVAFVDEASGTREEATLVYPADADPAHGLVSILAPVGSALIGLRVGQSIDWAFPSGPRHLRVVAVTRDDTHR